jgi:hypothetical protein
VWAFDEGASSRESAADYLNYQMFTKKKYVAQQ